MFTALAKFKAPANYDCGTMYFPCGGFPEDTPSTPPDPRLPRTMEVQCKCASRQMSDTPAEALEAFHLRAACRTASRCVSLKARYSSIIKDEVLSLAAAGKDFSRVSVFEFGSGRARARARTTNQRRLMLKQLHANFVSIEELANLFREVEASKKLFSCCECEAEVRGARCAVRGAGRRREERRARYRSPSVSAALSRGHLGEGPSEVTR
ncbi:hypothetical protein RR46_15024 [Papilio xuthus]|uniref:Uncharacterized protein n=1 Tax=Papilio xuthus TaxID=66420 RepID=A0A194PK98_PAPXU|nr:hypothetical protein RR46_15024 [Papilio xuthus]